MQYILHPCHLKSLAPQGPIQKALARKRQHLALWIQLPIGRQHHMTPQRLKMWYVPHPGYLLDQHLWLIWLYPNHTQMCAQTRPSMSTSCVMDFVFQIQTTYLRAWQLHWMELTALMEPAHVQADEGFYKIIVFYWQKLNTQCRPPLLPHSCLNGWCQ